MCICCSVQAVGGGRVVSRACVHFVVVVWVRYDVSLCVRCVSKGGVVCVCSPSTLCVV